MNSTSRNNKMLRISIKWTDRMLMVGAASCDIMIEKLNPLSGNVAEIIFKARGKVDRYTHGYSECVWHTGMTEELFNESIKPYLDCMMLSYQRGMCLEDQDYHWIQDWRKVD